MPDAPGPSRVRDALRAFDRHVADVEAAADETRRGRRVLERGLFRAGLQGVEFLIGACEVFPGTGKSFDDNETKEIIGYSKVRCVVACQDGKRTAKNFLSLKAQEGFVERMKVARVLVSLFAALIAVAYAPPPAAPADTTMVTGVVVIPVDEDTAAFQGKALGDATVKGGIGLRSAHGEMAQRLLQRAVQSGLVPGTGLPVAGKKARG